MKYYVLAACICLMGAVAIMVSNPPQNVATSNASKEWKVYAVETETSVRPERFEQMRYHPEPRVELRGPASTSKKKN